jgi:hypothetical protein
MSRGDLIKTKTHGKVLYLFSTPLVRDDQMVHVYYESVPDPVEHFKTDTFVRVDQ